MAQFNADIKLNADARAVERAIDRLEKRLERLREKASSIMDGGSKGPKALLPPAELTRAQKFEKFIDNWFAGVKKLNSAFSTAVMSLTLASGILDDELKLIDQQFKAVSNVNKALFLQGDTLSKLGKEAARIDKIWNNTRYTYQRFNVLAARQVELEDRRAELLRRQADAIRRQRLEQERLYEAVRRNVRRSEAGRQDSGFAAFSQEAGGAVRRRVAQDRQAQIDAINDVERLRESKSLNSYKTRQRRIRYLADLQDSLDRKLERSRDRRRQRREREQIATTRKQSRDRTNRLESIALGVGFPLLFGAGPGSILGSLAGSFAGSGFGGQIIGGAIGQIVDEFIQSATDLGKALGRPTEAFNYLKDASLTSSKQLERFVEQLEAAGFGAQASAAAQRDFARSIGRENAQNLVALGDAADRGSRAWAQAVARFQGRLAGPVAGFSGRLARGGEISNLRASISDLSDSLERAGKGDAARELRERTNPFLSFGRSQDEIIQQYRAAILEAEKELPPLKIKLDPRQIREELINTLGKQLETIDLGKNLIQQVRDRARAQEDLDQQRADAVLQQERAIADLRLSVEQRVQGIRLANLQRENELLNVQAQIREQSLANQNIALRNRFTDDRTSQVASAVADYLEAELKAANDAAKIRRDAALEVQRLEIETERFKLQVAKQVARLNEENAKRIAEINKGIRRQNQDQDTRRFEIEKKIAEIRLRQSGLDFGALAQQANKSGAIELERLATAGVKLVQESLVDLNNIKAPPALKELAAIASAGVSTEGVDTANAQAVTLLKNIQAARLSLIDLVRQGNYQQLEATLGKILIDPLTKAREEAFSVWDAINGQGRTTPAAERSAALTRTLEQLKELRDLIKDPAVQKALDIVIGRLPADTKATEDAVIATDLLRTLNDEFYSLTDQLDAASQPLGKLTRYQQVYNELARQGIDVDSAYAKVLLDRAKAVDELSFKLQEAQVYSQALENVFSGVGNAIAQSITFGVQSIINGTKSAQEVFADFLNNVSQLLVQTAAQMIAQYIAIGIARAFAMGGTSGSKMDLSGTTTTNVPVDQMPAGMAFADGDYPPVGQASLVGERGPELFIPGQQGLVVPNDIFDATRQALTSSGGTDQAFSENSEALAVANSYTRERMFERERQTMLTGAGGSTTVQTQVINNVEYATIDQVQEVANLSAKKARAQVFSDMRNRPSTRASLGMG